MPKASGAANKTGEPSKRQLQRRMEQTRESLARTVGEIKETVDHEVRAVKKTVSGVLDYREEFQNEPLVWSLGALSAGFALGYTLGYGHQHTRGGKQPAAIAFANSMIDELSTMGHGLVMPALNAKIKELFGFEFSELLERMSSTKKQAAKRSSRKRITSNATSKRAARKR